MKTIINLIIQVLLVCALLFSIQCSSNSKESAKEEAEDRNEEKFETKRGEQDAKFVVDAVDDSYRIIELAELASKKGTENTIHKAKEILVGQRRILKQLQAYAAKEVISVPGTGPENLRDTQKNLFDDDSEFDKKWCREMLNENEQMLRTFEEYSEKTQGNLKIVIAESLPTLRSQQDKLQTYQDAVAVK
jgi:putative membrane protein